MDFIQEFNGLLILTIILFFLPCIDGIICRLKRKKHVKIKHVNSKGQTNYIDFISYKL